MPVKSLIRYRPFQNWDPPALAEIWRSQPPLRGRMQGITPAMLEELVFARPFFEREGLIVAVDGARPVGFVHAGFGASDDLQKLDRSLGTTCLLLTVPHERQGETETELLEAAEDYLRRSGSRRLFGGCAFPVNPFYLGLYGSSDLPGVLASDSAAIGLFQSRGYREAARRILLSRGLDNYRPPIDRRLLQHRRRCVVTATHDIRPDNWWESCLWIHAEWTRYELRFRDSEEILISAVFWDITPLARCWGVQAMGLVRLEDTPEARDEGLSLYLLAEALMDMQKHGVAVVEVQTEATDATALALMEDLGLTEQDQGILFEKE